MPIERDLPAVCDSDSGVKYVVLTVNLGSFGEFGRIDEFSERINLSLMRINCELISLMRFLKSRAKKE